MKTHKITRKNLIELRRLFSSCSKWKEKITDCLIENVGTSVTIDDKILQEAYNEANPQQKTIIEKYFKIENPVDICAKIKNWKDILKLSGKKEADILPWKNPKTKEQISQNALAKIQIITEVYNQGIKIDWNNRSQYKYYPWFEKVSSDWRVLDVHACCWLSRFPVGFCFTIKTNCNDAVSKFKDIYTEYLG